MIDFKNFQRPQRYIGNEWNVIKKSLFTKIKICLSYPDLYEIGMSNLGIKIIYGLLNEYPDVVCERVFMPADDLNKFLREKKRKLFSLESKTPLDKFEILGFHLGCELNFTNFLSILDLGQIPLKAEEREETIVFGGSIANPEPLAEFVDLFFLGEFEEAADGFINVLREYSNKKDRLKALALMDGFYVPKFYSATVRNNRYQSEKKYFNAKLPVKRVYVKDLDASYYPLKWLTPHGPVIHDRAQIEISRGCPNQCTFCQARALYQPYRQRSIGRIKQLMEEIYKYSGYEDFSFLSLSASDYSNIQGLIDEIWDYCKKRRIGISLPSLRIDDIVGPLHEKLNSLKKTSLTVAVEAPTECLRKTLNKNIDVNKLFKAAQIIRSLKTKYIKIYFMFGLPGEKEDDLIAIGKFLNKLRQNSRLDLKASINIFIPKPLSFWQSAKMDTEQVLEEKRKIILSSAPKTHAIKISLSSTKKSIIEAVISRADRKFSKVLYRAYKNGAKFDAYNEHFSWDIWKNAMEEEKVDYRSYLSGDIENHPWSFIENHQNKNANNQIPLKGDSL